MAPLTRTLTTVLSTPLRRPPPALGLTFSPWRRFESTWSPNAQPLPTSVAPEPPPTTITTSTTAAPLARLPTSALVRALLLHSVTANPVTLKMGVKVLSRSIDSIERKRPLKWVVDKSFYAQYCAGHTESEIRATAEELRGLGYAGMILSYAREVEKNDTSTSTSQSEQISQWLEGILNTIAYTDPGSYVAVKYTGAGMSSLPLLHDGKKCFENPQLGDAIVQICEAAKKKGVRLMMDAEQTAVQDGIDAWTLSLMRKYNRESAVVFNTYQMYLRRAPDILREHLALAQSEGWTLGAKVVRGAYLHTDPREAIWATKADTDAAYDDAIKLLLTSSPSSKSDLVIATHNKHSLLSARSLRASLNDDECGVGEMVFAQLLGMADELSLAMVAGGQGKDKVYKYAVWGTTSECVKYLIRRAEENKDAVGRSMENRQACWNEIRRRAGLGGDTTV